MKPRIVVTVGPDGTVSAETLDILGESCLDYIAVLEDLIDGKVQSSVFTEDFDRQTSYAENQQVNRDVDPA